MRNKYNKIHCNLHIISFNISAIHLHQRSFLNNILLVVMRVVMLWMSVSSTQNTRQANTDVNLKRICSQRRSEDERMCEKTFSESDDISKV